MISHELRNVLSGFTGLGEQLAASGLAPKQLSLVRALQQSTRQMCWLVEALGLDGENAHLSLSPRFTNVHGIELLEQLIRCHILAAVENGKVLLLTIGSEIPSTWRCDERLLRLVLDNLLGNAIKYGGPGEIVLEVASDAAATGLEISVRDSGPGVETRAQTRMFDPWVRCDMGRSGVDGAGLGLYLCERIMSRLDGSIVYTANGVDESCFTLNLPGVASTQARQPAPVASGLIQSVTCVLSLPGSLQGSLAAILARLGVSRIVANREELADLPATVCIVEITDRCPAQIAGRQHGGLLFTAGANDRGISRTIRSSWLPRPFLESTVGPVLMALALEHRIFRMGDALLSPGTGETQDSVPKLR